MARGIKNTGDRNFRLMKLQILLLAGLFFFALGAGGVWLWWYIFQSPQSEAGIALSSQREILRNRRDQKRIPLVLETVPQVNPTVVRRIISVIPKREARRTKLSTPIAKKSSKASAKIAASVTGVMATKSPSVKQLWRKHAVQFQSKPGSPVVAIVIDDMGMNIDRARRTIALGAPLTIAILPYGPAASETARAARKAGHEVLVHLPMQPVSGKADPGPNALLLGLPHTELTRRFNWNLSQFEGYVGINNHMGSKFTANHQAMAWVISELSSRGLLFLDSYTSDASSGSAVAQSFGLPYATRDIFIDHDTDPANIAEQLEKAAVLARRNGSVILIGHPHDNTLKALATWIKQVKGAGMQLAPISALVRHSRKSKQANRGAGINR